MVKFIRYFICMYHINYQSVSLSLLVSVTVAAGLSVPGRAEVTGDGTLRLARVLPDEPLFQCMAASEFTLAGLKLYDDTAALSALGAPRSMTRGYGEDDGGGYVATTYHYDGLEVDVVRGKLDRIEANSPRWPTMAGLKPGMTRAEAVTLMGREPENLHDGIHSFTGCPDWRDGELVWDNVANYFEFGFGADGLLSFVRLIADRP